MTHPNVQTPSMHHFKGFAKKILQYEIKTLPKSYNKGRRTHSFYYEFLLNRRYVLIFTVLDENISQTVKFLIDHGVNAKMSAVNSWAVLMLGFTALIFASRDGFFKTVKHLITNGAEVDAQTSFGYTALMVSFDLLIPTKIVFRGKEPNGFPKILCISLQFTTIFHAWFHNVL